MSSGFPLCSATLESTLDLINALEQRKEVVDDGRANSLLQDRSVGIGTQCLVPTIPGEGQPTFSGMYAHVSPVHGRDTLDESALQQVGDEPFGGSSQAEKNKRRRDQVRLASKRFRERRKDRMEGLEKENAELQAEVERLSKENKVMKELLQQLCGRFSSVDPLEKALKCKQQFDRERLPILRSLAKLLATPHGSERLKMEAKGSAAAATLGKIEKENPLGGQLSSAEDYHAASFNLSSHDAMLEDDKSHRLSALKDAVGKRHRTGEGEDSEVGYEQGFRRVRMRYDRDSMNQVKLDREIVRLVNELQYAEDRFTFGVSEVVMAANRCGKCGDMTGLCTCLPAEGVGSVEEKQGASSDDAIKSMRGERAFFLPQPFFDSVGASVVRKFDSFLLSCSLFNRSDES